MLLQTKAYLFWKKPRKQVCPSKKQERINSGTNWIATSPKAKRKKF